MARRGNGKAHGALIGQRRRRLERWSWARCRLPTFRSAAALDLPASSRAFWHPRRRPARAAAGATRPRVREQVARGKKLARLSRKEAEEEAAGWHHLILCAHRAGGGELQLHPTPVCPEGWPRCRSKTHKSASTRPADARSSRARSPSPATATNKVVFPRAHLATQEARAGEAYAGHQGHQFCRPEVRAAEAELYDPSSQSSRARAPRAPALLHPSQSGTGAEVAASEEERHDRLTTVALLLRPKPGLRFVAQ